MIKQPSFAPESIPTPMGWVGPQGAMVSAIQLSPDDIREWYSAQSGPQMLNEAPSDGSFHITGDMKRHFWGES